MPVNPVVAAAEAVGAAVVLDEGGRAFVSAPRAAAVASALAGAGCHPQRFDGAWAGDDGVVVDVERRVDPGGLGALLEQLDDGSLVGITVPGGPRPLQLDRLDDPARERDARARLAAALQGPHDVSDAWLGSTRLAVIEETGRGPDGDQASRLSDALKTMGWVRPLLALDLERDVSYVLDPAPPELRALAWARAGLDCALIPAEGLDWVMLLTHEDYLLLAGPEPFVRAYAPDPAALAEEMRELGAFIGGAYERLPAMRHLDWMEAATPRR